MTILTFQNPHSFDVLVDFYLEAHEVWFRRKDGGAEPSWRQQGSHDGNTRYKANWEEWTLYAQSKHWKLYDPDLEVDEGL